MRGIRAKAGFAGDDPHIDRSAIDTQKSAADGPRAGSISTWAMLIKRVYEVDPLECPQCGGAMKIISFIERCQADVPVGYSSADLASLRSLGRPAPHAGHRTSTTACLQATPGRT